MTTQIAAVFIAVGVTMILAVWHDPQTMRAIAGSGGLGETYTLPFITIVPAVAIGSIGSILGVAARKLPR